MTAKKVKPVEVVIVSYNEYIDTEFVFPSRYMFRDAMGQYVFIKTNKREVAVKYIQDNYNGVYSVRDV